MTKGTIEPCNVISWDIFDLFGAYYAFFAYYADEALLKVQCPTQCLSTPTKMTENEAL